MTDRNAAYNIAVLPGDGVGPEVMSPCLDALDFLARRLGGFQWRFQECAGGGGHYQDTGEELTAETWSAERTAPKMLPRPL